MNKQSQATQRPWMGEHQTAENNRTGSIIFGKDGWEVCKIEGYSITEVEANAELIVKAVNSHEILISGVREAIDYFENKPELTEDEEFILERLEAALKLAE